MDRQSHHLLLRAPAPTQQTLSFCDASVRGVTGWLAGLPKANIGETARLLYQALIELNQLRVASDTRLQMLELLRPDVYFVCTQLEKHYINQPIVLSERPRKVAGLCQALQNHLAVGYKLIVVRVVSQPDRDRHQLLSVALQRAIASLGALLIRSTQLYGPPAPGLWLELHQLYQLAVDQGTERLLVRDPLARHAKGLSAEQNYLASLLLGCARCNQMRQQSIVKLAAALEAWGAMVQVQAASDANSLFLLSPSVDGPPRYRSLFPDRDQLNLLGIDTRMLVELIEEHLRLAADNRQLTRLPAAAGLDDDLLRHLSAAWGAISERTFQRTPAQGTLTLCIGMTALHYQLAGQRPFKEVLELPGTSNRAVFKLHNGAADVWANAFDAQDTPVELLPTHDHIEYVRPDVTRPAPTVKAATPATTPPRSSPDTENHPIYQVQRVDHSPGGYCLAWEGDVPSQLQTGELLGLRDGNAHNWSIAVVRWIRQVRGGSTQMGVELIAPQAQPCGLRLLRKVDQGSAYLRALLLPEISAISQPAMLIAPRLPFQEGHKVQINCNGEEQRAVLNRRRASTGNYNQFEYRSLAQVSPERETPVTGWKSHTPGGDEDFDSLWKSL
ncbi:molecular chaperone [Pseudomonas stutzeri]|uniref:Molecular chaperone n=1 Tax=Stutzerimonas stutzeri TaxID=316 RepID=A0A2N8S4C1_STUST|nr:molecular chaperone [Stutzerimonas stutzeri]MCQ4294148.1 molecular chaperone [Stutzerimonas stutzeri]PNF81459.1 molecular chaperone [Stutzerimonas stutzeri]